MVYVLLNRLTFGFFIVFLAMTIIANTNNANATSYRLLYGVCKTFLELQIRNPHTLKINKLIAGGNEKNPVVSMRFSMVNGAGSLVVERMDCFFQVDEKQTKMTLVEWNKQPVDNEVIDRFNPVIPILLSNPPDTTLPAPLPDSLYELYIQK